MPAALLEVIDEYLAELQLERGLSRATVGAYEADLRQFAAHAAAAGVKEWREARGAQVTDWLYALTAGGLATSSLARKLSAVRMLARWLVQRGRRADDLTALVQGPRRVRPLPRALGKVQVERLLAVPDAGTPHGRRDRAILELFYSSGLRLSELCGLRVTDVVLDEALVRVRGKGDKERVVPVGGPAVAAIRAYLAEGRAALAGDRAGGALFLSERGRPISRKTVWVMVRAAARRAGLAEGVKPHQLRHTFATHLLSGGADLRVIQEMLGHADIGTTQIYTAVEPERVVRDHARYHPRGRVRGGPVRGTADGRGGGGEGAPVKPGG